MKNLTTDQEHTVFCEENWFIEKDKIIQINFLIKEIFTGILLTKAMKSGCISLQQFRVF